MFDRLTVPFVLGLAIVITGCSPKESESPEPAPASVESAEAHTDADTAEVLAFLRGQGGTLVDLDESTLGELRAVRLNADYTAQELSLLRDSKTSIAVRYGWAGESKRWLAAFRTGHPDTEFSIE